MIANVAAFFWVPALATLAPGPDAWTTTGRVRMIFPAIGLALVLSYVPIVVASMRAARAATRERDARPAVVLTHVVLAVLALALVGSKIATELPRYVALERAPLVVVWQIVGSLLVLAIAAAVAQAPRAHVAGAVALSALVAAELTSYFSPWVEAEAGMAGTIASALATALLTLAGWIAIGIGLRRARQPADPPVPLATTFE